MKRVGLMAIDVLEEAYIVANYTPPIDPDIAQRLALGYLMLTGCASPAIIAELWKILRHKSMYDNMSTRQSHFGSMLDGIKMRIKKLR